MCGFQLRKLTWTSFLENEKKSALGTLLKRNECQDF